MKTYIKVCGLTIFGRHGVLSQESTVGNEFVYDIELEYPFINAAKSDDLGKTLNYAEVIKIIDEVNITPARLLETVAYKIYETLNTRFPAIVSGSISITKKYPPIPSCQVDGASVRIDW